ncbi:replication protein P [Pseudomonas syringae]|uniref:replication protein P n=1 Tax=Pseudomonas syringae TaxID=317 RepID=UPI000CD9FE5C|nr:replication protein P [Pseudomonas syringae]POR72833.1 replication P family protein [Pseudomonas syringae pv. syringae]POR81896.1 replication P family protein [Pseudomonas syringae pv. syringae]
MNGPVRAGYLVEKRKTDPTYSGVPAVAVEIDPATRQVIDELFLRLRGACGAWRQSWPTEEVMNAAKLEWLAEFMRSGINSMDQLRHGMRMVSASKSAFVPAPGVFVSWCFAPEGLGLPSVEVAYSQALRNSHPGMEGRGKWFHPAIYHATAAAGFMSLQTLPRELGIARFEQKYSEQCRKIWRGEELPPVPVAQLAAPVKSITPEVGNQALAELRAKRSGDTQ